MESRWRVAGEIENIAVGVVGDGVANANVPGAVQIVLDNGKLAEVVVGVLHRIIRRLACPVLYEVGGFDSAVVIIKSVPVVSV